MGVEPLCPLFGRDEQLCPLGCEYLSPHDVEVVVRYCTARYRDCLTYGRWSERELPVPEGEGERGPATPTHPRAPATSLDPGALVRLHHELRTPLTNIRSFAEILLRYPVEELERKRHFLTIIGEEAERLASRVDALLGDPDGRGGDPALGALVSPDPPSPRAPDRSPDAPAQRRNTP
ncbi:MAG: hypothetical protein Kow0092_36580 [Deferrisomatales bacterium]